MNVIHFICYRQRLHMCNDIKQHKWPYLVSNYSTMWLQIVTYTKHHKRCSTWILGDCLMSLGKTMQNYPCDRFVVFLGGEGEGCDTWLHWLFHLLHVVLIHETHTQFCQISNLVRVEIHNEWCSFTIHFKKNSAWCKILWSSRLQLWESFSIVQQHQKHQLQAL